MCVYFFMYFTLNINTDTDMKICCIFDLREHNTGHSMIELWIYIYLLVYMYWEICPTDKLMYKLTFDVCIATTGMVSTAVFTIRQLRYIQYIIYKRWVTSNEWCGPICMYQKTSASAIRLLSTLFIYLSQITTQMHYFIQ